MVYQIEKLEMLDSSNPLSKIILDDKKQSNHIIMDFLLARRTCERRKNLWRYTMAEKWVEQQKLSHLSLLVCLQRVKLEKHSLIIKLRNTKNNMFPM